MNLRRCEKCGHEVGAIGGTSGRSTTATASTAGRQRSQFSRRNDIDLTPEAIRIFGDDVAAVVEVGPCRECGTAAPLPYGGEPGDSVLSGLCGPCAEAWMPADHPLVERLYKEYANRDGYGRGVVLPCGHSKGDDCDPACSAVEDMSATAFTVWLATQADRADGVGEIACHQQADACWPSADATLADCMEHIEKGHSGSWSVVVALRTGWREWFWAMYRGERPWWDSPTSSAPASCLVNRSMRSRSPAGDGAGRRPSGLRSDRTSTADHR
jgi:hypothetical protein